MLNFNSRPKQSLLRPFLAMISASSLALIGVIAVPAATETASAETVFSQKGFSIDGEAEFDRSGYSVALSSNGSRVAIGAFNNDGDNGVDSGQVRIYDLAAGTWTKVGADIDGEAENDFSGYSVALSSNGSRVAIGARSNDGDTGVDSGHVRIYDLVEGAWIQVGEDIDGEAAGDFSGWSVALSSNGSRVAIGARYNDGDNGVYSGHVRIYDLVDGAWIQVGEDIDGEAADDFSGQSVALSSNGSRVAIGAIFNRGNGGVGSYAGHVRIYDLVDGTWTKVGSDIDGEAAGDFSGQTVALSSNGSRVAIGAPDNDGDNGVDSGHVRIYDLVDGAWTKVGSDIDGEAAGDLSGQSVALSSDGSLVAIGATGNDGNGDRAGHVRIYDLVDGTWTEVGSGIDGQATNDNAGFSVALSGDGSRVAIGAPYNDGNGNDAGQVILFSLFELKSALTPTFGTLTNTRDGFTIQVSNFDAGFSWNVSVSAGSASISGTGLITVTGLSAGDSSTVTVSTTRSDYSAGSATVSGSTLKSALTPTFSTPTNTRDGFTIQVSNFDAGFSWNVSVSAGSASISGTGLITVTGLSAGDSSTVTVSTTRSGYSAGSAKAESAVDKKLTVGSFKGFIAIYTKGYEGSKLSAKVAGKWLVVDSLDESWRGNDYSRTVRFTGAGYEIFVHLYIDGEYVRTDELTTK